MSEEALLTYAQVVGPSTPAFPDLGGLASTDREPSTTLKRRASPSFEGLDTDSRKRLKEDMSQDHEGAVAQVPCIPDISVVDDLAEELQCGCCSALLYRPVVVYPCQHYFCGSCCALWVRNGGTNCPACRGVSKQVMPSRPLQLMIDVLLRHDPSRARSEREKEQADEVYRNGVPIHIPTPREASPEPNLHQSAEFARPCPHCAAGNRYGWRCPHPVPDPVADPDNAWHTEDGCPPGHGYCGNCENLLALQAPTTSKCDMCQVSFCGIGVQGRCIAASLLAQHPHGMADLSDLIQSAEVYECFDGNAIEVDILLDHLSAQRITPRHIYRDIVEYISHQPRKFAPLLERDLFTDVHNVVPGPDPGIDSPRQRICRMCATEVLLYGLRDWWVRERQRGFLDPSVMNRPDCPDGSHCEKQHDQSPCAREGLQSHHHTSP
ncbi:hypothetical protein DENSPDRAFT_652747 [Dentipellis sp. KUC8613]|nr:hypothetical protein DENSPDRAFT_652747 [Dentipellis sp. KUC8613]